MRILFTLCLLLFVSAQQSAGVEPSLKWVYNAQSNLYAPPLVADMHPNPGLETILSDSEARRVRCIGSDGQQIWELDGGWTMRLTTSAALTRAKGSGNPTLLIGSSDGRLLCIDAKTGTVLWKNDVGKIEWGGAVWADLDGDGEDEGIAGTESNGIHVFTLEGKPLWVFPSVADQPKPNLFCPLAASDVDKDGRCDIFGVDRMGPFRLSGHGELIWKTTPGDEFRSTAILGDADGDGRPELYAGSMDDNALWCFDALDGHVLWKSYLLSGLDANSGSSLCMGDLNGDGTREIVLSDKAGHLYCFDSHGKNLWTFQTEQPRELAPSLGDVDGDGLVEVLAAGGDHCLYCLSPSGELEWKVATDLRLLNPATITDVDMDGMTDILVCGSDRKLRCYTLGGPCRPQLVPWPSRRFDIRQSGSCFNHRDSSAGFRVPVAASLLREGGFENSKTPAWKPETPALEELAAQRQREPRGWLLEQGDDTSWRLDKEIKLSGSSSLQVTPGQAAVVVRSEAIPVKADLRSVSAAIRAKGASTAQVWLEWGGATGLIRKDSLGAGPADSSGWKRFYTQGISPPMQAKWLSLVCVVEPGKPKPVHFDDAAVSGNSDQLPTVRPLVNQVGYDMGAPKMFTAQSNFLVDDASFELIDMQGAAVFSGKLEKRGRISGAYGSDWGSFYWSGDFTTYDAPGTYRIRANVGGVSEISWPFQIGDNQLWAVTSRPAYRFFYYQRCGMEIPGFHAACHLDDAASSDGLRQFDLTGGWHDAGDYNKYYNAPYVLGLATAYSLAASLFEQQDEDENGISDFLDEIVWGAEHCQRMVAADGSVHAAITSGYGFWSAPEIETDNIPGTGDERRTQGSDTGNDPSEHAAALAKAARLTHRHDFVVTAEKALGWSLEKGQKGALQLSAAIDLFAVTDKQEYEDLAREIFEALGPADTEITRNYDRTFFEDHTEALRKRLIQEADEILSHASNPFGICTFGSPDQPNFFNTPADSGGWHVGTSSHLLSMANKVAQAYAYAPDPRYLKFIYDQFNWTLGGNPYEVCLMEGAGSRNLPSYHHRYTFGGVPRGAVPGSVVNGVTWKGVGDDRPYLDMSGADIPDFEPNEVWLPHNMNYLQVLANLRLCRGLPGPER